MSERPYSPAFYALTDDGSRRSANAIVPLVIDHIRPASVVDVGCGGGHWLRAFRERGISDLTGLDGPWAAPKGEVPYAFHEIDLTRPFSLARSFDLAVSLEVGEHLPESAADGFVQSLTGLAPVVLFSAAIPRQGGIEHSNEQWPEYWAGLFARRQFVAVDCIRRRVWNSNHVEWWYCQNTILYVARARLDAMPALAAEATRTDSSVLSLVHPRAYLYQAALRDDAKANPDPAVVPASRLLRLVPKVLGHAIRRRLTSK